MIIVRFDKYIAHGLNVHKLKSQSKHQISTIFTIIAGTFTKIIKACSSNLL